MAQSAATGRSSRAARRLIRRCSTARAEKENPAGAGGAFVHSADWPNRACARLSPSAELRPTRAPAPCGSRTVRRFAPRRKPRFPQGASFFEADATIPRMRGVLYALLAALVLATSSAARPAQLQHVVLIGDSVADAIPNDSRAVALLSQGVDLELQVAPCRRLEGEGCPYQGVRPPS